MLSHVIARLATQASPVAINANDGAARFGAFGLPVLPDAVEGFPGPLAGILTAMTWAKSLGADMVVTTPCDSPFFPENLVEALHSGSAGAQGRAAIAATKDTVAGTDDRLTYHAVFGLWPVALADRLEQEISRGVRKVTAFALEAGAIPVVIGSAARHPFLNINTPDDLVRAEAAFDC